MNWETDRRFGCWPICIAKCGRRSSDGTSRDSECCSKNLRDTLLRRNLSLDVLELVDADIVSELLAIVMMRYRRSMDDAVSYHLALIKVAGHLKSIRYAEAPGI